MAGKKVYKLLAAYLDGAHGHEDRHAVDDRCPHPTVRR